MSADGSIRRLRLLLMVSCGWSVRNYLRSGFLDTVRREMDITVMLPPGDAVLESEVSQRGLTVARLFDAPAPRWLTFLSGLTIDACNFRLGYWEPAFWNWTLQLQPKRKQPYWILKKWLAKVASYSPFYNMCRWLERRGFRALADLPGNRAAFAEIRPDVVLSTDPYHVCEIVGSLRALDQGCPAVAAIVSWDHLSYKGQTVADYSRFAVWGEAMREDVFRHHRGIDPKRVAITGTPQFDFHLRRDLDWGREEFFRRIGGDPKRRLITYSGAAVEWAFPKEAEVVEQLWHAIQQGRVTDRPQLLVRPHPIDRVGRFTHLEKTCPGIIVQRPWPRAIDEYWWFTPDVDQLAMLSNTLRYSDVNVNYASSMTLDAAIFDKPVVNVAYTTVPQDPRAARVETGHLGYHYRAVVANKAALVARNLDELVEHLNDSLRQPARHRAGRQRAVDWLCGPVDARAGDRIAALVVECAGKRRAQVAAGDLATTT